MPDERFESVPVPGRADDDIRADGPTVGEHHGITLERFDRGDHLDPARLDLGTSSSPSVGMLPSSSNAR